MDKQRIIELTKSGKLDLEVVYDYCIEMGKDEIEVNKFITLLLSPQSLTEFEIMCFCCQYALEYYQRKFNIVIWKDKNGKLIDAY